MGPKDGETCMNVGVLSHRTEGTKRIKRLVMHKAHPILWEQLINCELRHIHHILTYFIILLLALELISSTMCYSIHVCMPDPNCLIRNVNGFPFTK